jgi:hypothetical protein
MSDLGNLLLGFGFNLLVAVIIVRLIYYPSTHNKPYVFTFLAFNTVIFFVLSFMSSIELGLGVGFGLFAIFSILRYRTDPIPIREMTYLFIIAALPVMNMAGTDGEVWPQLVAANLAVIVIMAVLEKGWGFRYEASKRVLYEKIELVRPERRDDLMADLQERTGLVIKRVAIEKVDFVRDTASLKIYYDESGRDPWVENADAVLLLDKDDDD